MNGDADSEDFTARSVLRWIDTTGGPHILVTEQDLAEWKGCQDWDGNSPNDPSDYARACRNSASWLSLIPSTHGDIVVFEGDVGSIAWFPTSDISGIFVQWIGCDSDAAVLAMLAKNTLGHVKKRGDEESILLETGPSGRMLLLDASTHGRQVAPADVEEISLVPGRYRIKAFYVDTPDCMAVVRELSRVQQT